MNLKEYWQKKYYIQMELADFYNVLAVGSFGDTKENMDKLINALKEISNEYYGKKEALTAFFDIRKFQKSFRTKGCLLCTK